MTAGLVALTTAEDFGRFGYRKDWTLPSFSVDAAGFKIRHDLADKLKFPQPVRTWSPVSTSSQGQTVFLGGAQTQPEKLRCSLSSPGFEIFYRDGFALHLTTTGAPYLTWADGSVGPGVPTPKSKWIAISFRDDQPPILMAFPGGDTALKLDGKPGNWILTPTEPFTGWLRVLPPFGVRPFRTNSAAELGELVQAVKRIERTTVDPAPELTTVELSDEPQGLNVTWTYDRPGALIPTPMALASLGNYPLRVMTPITTTEVLTADGPMVFAETNQLGFRLPARRIPIGRPIGIGTVQEESIGTVSSLDYRGVVELGLSSLMSWRDPITRQSAQETLDQFLEEATYTPEPFSNQRLPYAADGEGLDVTASHAFLMQCLLNATRADSAPNSLLTSVLWRRDAMTWQVWADDPVKARRAAALAALAAGICAEPERRYEGALLQAGLAAEKGLRIWKARRSIVSSSDRLIEPMLHARDRLYSMTNAGPDSQPFFDLLSSTIRTMGDVSITANSLAERSTEFSGTVSETRQFSFSIISGYPVTFRAGENIAGIETSEAFGTTIVRFRPKQAGRWTMKLDVPAWAPALPKAVAPPRYSE